MSHTRRMHFMSMVASVLAVVGMDSGRSTLHAATDNGVPVNGHPNWQERAVLALTNAVRMAPAQYRNTYLPAGNDGILNGPPIAPIYWNLDLNEAARAHAVDMAVNNYFSHTSQNGTTWTQRIAAAGYAGSPVFENIAAGNSAPQATMQQWLLSTSGHLQAIMSTSCRELGVGYGFNAAAQYDHYWVQDFGSRSFTIQSPICGGSHIFPSSGAIRFLLNVDDPAMATSPPQSVTLWLNGTNHAMNLHMGVVDRGTYERTFSTVGGGCRPYHFVVVNAAGASWRYPETGELLTTGESGCTQAYQPGSPPTEPGDVNGDGLVGIADLLAVIGAWGPCANPNTCPTDVAPQPDGDNVTGIADLLLVIANWG